MNFSNLSLKCYPTRVNEILKHNYKTKIKKKYQARETLFFELLSRGVQETPNTYSLWLLPFLPLHPQWWKLSSYC